MKEDLKDVLTNGGSSGHGDVAQRLAANGMNVNALRTNAVLRKDEWIQYDTAVVEVARERLAAVGDLVSRNLTLNIQNALGTTVVQWENVSDMDPADVSMSGVTQGERDRVEFSLQSVPLPIIHKDFEINLRALEASRRLGETLDTTQAALASRLVSERIENILFNGANITVTNSTIYGYTTHPARNTGAVSAAWATATGEQIVSDIVSMMSDLAADNMYGPYALYVPTAVYAHFADDYKTNSDRTILERILAIPEIEVVRGTSNLTGSNVVLVQLTRDVVDVVDGIQPMPVQWESQGGFVVHFKVLAIMIPRVKADAKGQCGIAHYS